MRAGVVLAASVLVACESSQATPDAVVGPTDAAVIDAAPIDAPLEAAPIAWTIELEETATIVSAAAVPGGFVFVGRQELFRVSDDGADVVRRAVPDDWGNVELTAARGGDVLAFVFVNPPEPKSVIVRIDGATLDVEWTYVVDGASSYNTARVIDLEDRTLAVVTTTDDTSQAWTLHDIDASGTGTVRDLDLPNGTIDGLMVRDDGIVESVWRQGWVCARWHLDPTSATWSTTPLAMSEHGSNCAAEPTAAGLLVHFDDEAIGAGREVGALIGADGGVVIPETVVAAGLVGRGTFVGAARIVGLESTRVWDAPRADPAAARERILPLRPGGYALQSVMASDGERAFVAWLDQVSTFDTVLRVARLGELQ